MTLQIYDEKMLSSVPQSISINDLTIGASMCLTDSYQIKISELKKSVLDRNINYSVNIEKHKSYLDKINLILSKLPKLVEFVKVKPVIPEFEEIEVLKGDSAEIKKFIRKANYDFIGFHCNHKMYDKQYEKMDSLIASIYESTEYKTYDSLIESFALTLKHIIEYDKIGETVSYVEVCELESDAHKLVDLTLKLNCKIISANANVSPSCPKCRATVRKYNYVIKEVQRMREEQAEQEALDKEFIDKPAEDKYKMKEFLTNNYPTVDRFEMSDVKDKYKKTFGITLKIAELKTLIEETHMFKVTNSKNKYYVSRL